MNPFKHFNGFYSIMRLDRWSMKEKRETGRTGTEYTIGIGRPSMSEEVMTKSRWLWGIG
jgi:hypothetical protein